MIIEFNHILELHSILFDLVCKNSLPLYELPISTSSTVGNAFEFFST